MAATVKITVKITANIGEIMTAVRINNLEFFKLLIQRNGLTDDIEVLEDALLNSVIFESLDVFNYLIEESHLNSSNANRKLISDCFFYAMTKANLAMVKALFCNFDPIDQMEHGLYRTFKEGNIEFLKKLFREENIFDLSHIEKLDSQEGEIFCLKEDLEKLSTLRRDNYPLGQFTKPAKN